MTVPGPPVSPGVRAGLEAPTPDAGPRARFPWPPAPSLRFRVLLTAGRSLAGQEPPPGAQGCPESWVPRASQLGGEDGRSVLVTNRRRGAAPRSPAAAGGPLRSASAVRLPKDAGHQAVRPPPQGTAPLAPLATASPARLATVPFGLPGLLPGDCVGDGSGAGSAPSCPAGGLVGDRVPSPLVVSPGALAGGRARPSWRELVVARAGPGRSPSRPRRPWGPRARGHLSGVRCGGPERPRPSEGRGPGLWLLRRRLRVRFPASRPGGGGGGSVRRRGRAMRAL